MSKLIVKNKKAYYEYNILEKVIAGVQLKGSEVKSVKLGNVTISESYCFVLDNEIFIKNMHISEHKQGGIYNNHEPLRDRKLLLRKKEILTLNEKVKQKSLTIIPLAVFLSETGYIKIEIGLAKGKNTYDKKMSLKIKTLEKELRKDLD
jgi:SsrA-binding protein